MCLQVPFLRPDLRTKDIQLHDVGVTRYTEPTVLPWTSRHFSSAPPLGTSGGRSRRNVIETRVHVRGLSSCRHQSFVGGMSA